MMTKEYKLPNGKIIMFDYDAYGVGQVTLEAMDRIVDLLCKMTWIPCSERLPEESDGTVLVCFPDEFPYSNKEPYINAKHNQRVKTASYSQFNKTWYIGDFSAIGEVMPIAWMPLPESYKGSED